MQITEKQPVAIEPLLKNWATNEYIYTGDHLIDAYLRGLKDGKDEQQKILTQKFAENLDAATHAAEQLLANAKEMDVHFSDIRLKADGITQFTALFVTDVDAFISDHFRQVYTLAKNLKTKIESDSFFIDFSFMPSTGPINENTINADGYFLKYGERQ